MQNLWLVTKVSTDTFNTRIMLFGGNTNIGKGHIGDGNISYKMGKSNNVIYSIRPTPFGVKYR